MPERPLSRQMPCPACAPHEHHLRECDSCACTSPPIPGIYSEEGA